MNPTTKINLENRLGKDNLARRLDIEQVRCSCNGKDSPSRSHARFICSAVSRICKCTGLYGWGYRRFHALRITQNTLPIRGLPKAFEGFRIMHLSDMHLDLDLTFTQTLLDTIKKCSFDICVMTGDYRNFLDGNDTDMLTQMQKVADAIPQPKYAVLGNHDTVDSVPLFEAMGIRFLLNEHTVLHKEDASLVLAGIDDPNIFATHDIDRALAGAPQDVPIILLSHSPSAYRDALKYSNIVALLAGHLHGGQVCLPGGFILRVKEHSPRRLWRGAWQSKDGHLHGYTSTGSGGCGVPLRFFSHPEIVIHTLRGTDF